MDAPEPFWPNPARRGGEQRPPRCGIVDLGSNSVRLVVFEGRGRNPQAIFNEKAVLGLGRGLQNSGRLNEEAIGTALTVMVIDDGVGFATAAVAPDRLGLTASVEGRLTRVHGHVQVWSSPGSGTSIVLRVPFAAGAPVVGDVATEDGVPA